MADSISLDKYAQPGHQVWSDRQRLTNKLVRFCYEYLSQTKKLNAETIHALCKLTWITGGFDHSDNLARLTATKIPALETTFTANYSGWSLEEIAQDIQVKTGKSKSIVNPLITNYTGFTNFRNAYRNSSLEWIKENLRLMETILADAYSLKTDNQGAVLASKIETLSSIPTPSGDNVMHTEYLLSPLCFCMDPRVRFPIINGSGDVKAILRQFHVLNAGLVDKYSALTVLIGRMGVKDAADLDQLRSWDTNVVTSLKKRFKLAIPGSKNLALKDEEDYEIIQKNLTIKAKRIHNDLTNKLLKVFEGRILEGSNSCKYDALIEHYYHNKDLLIEVKSSTEIPDVRMAIGQLLDYHRQLEKRDNILMAVLLPKEPSQSVKDLLKYANTGLFWFSGDQLVDASLSK